MFKLLNCVWFSLISLSLSLTFYHLFSRSVFSWRKIYLHITDSHIMDTNCCFTYPENMNKFLWRKMSMCLPEKPNDKLTTSHHTWWWNLNLLRIQFYHNSVAFCSKQCAVLACWLPLYNGISLYVLWWWLPRQRKQKIY